jgi:hypothetical protein
VATAGNYLGVGRCGVPAPAAVIVSVPITASVARAINKLKQFRAMYGGKHVRLLRPDHLDPHAWVLHRLREVAAQRRPRLVGVPAVLEQQILDQRIHRRRDVRLVRGRGVRPRVPSPPGRRAWLLPYASRDARGPGTAGAQAGAYREESSTET